MGCEAQERVRYMLQVEIAGRIFPSPEEYPGKGSVLRDFQLRSAQGQPVLVSAYRGRFSLVLVFAGESNLAAQFLSELEAQRQELAESEARILVVVAGSQQHAFELKQHLHLKIEVLADVDGRVHRSMGAVDQAGHILPAVFVTDRFGEVFAAFKTAEGQTLPCMSEILSWIELISRQCPECGPVEWPE